MHVHLRSVPLNHLVHTQAPMLRGASLRQTQASGISSLSMADRRPFIAGNWKVCFVFHFCYLKFLYLGYHYHPDGRLAISMWRHMY